MIHSEDWSQSEYITMSNMCPFFISIDDGHHDENKETTTNKAFRERQHPSAPGSVNE